jgi:hypothetical protein
MPFDSDRAIVFLTQVRKMLEFQSTIDILKSMEFNCRVLQGTDGLNRSTVWL